MKYPTASPQIFRRAIKFFFGCLAALCLLVTACQNRVEQASSTSLGAPLTPTSPAASPAIDPRVTDLNRVVAGTAAPDFALDDLDGNIVKLSDSKGKKNVILVFYRGHF